MSLVTRVCRDSRPFQGSRNIPNKKKPSNIDMEQLLFELDEFVRFFFFFS